MNWEELKEKAKEMGAEIYISPFGDNFERIDYKNACFFNDGNISATDDDYCYRLYGKMNLATDRTPDQMLMIMMGLE